jgi:chromate reductase, NAD(P)H dehydrogenase (quinone)
VFLNVHAINQPEVMIANAAQNFDAEGNLTNESTKNLIRQLLTNLVTRTRGLEQEKGAKAVSS